MFWQRMGSFDSNIKFSGDKLFYAAVLDEPEEGEDTIIALPPGFWYSNGGPLTGEFYNGGYPLCLETALLI